MTTKPKRSIGHRLTYGDTLLTRLASLGSLPKGLAKFVADFEDIHASYSTWEKKVKSAEDARDSQLTKIAAADALQDASVDALANALVGAGLTPRTHPFQGFSKKPPSEVKDMAWLLEAEEIDQIAKKILRAKPSAAVKKAVASCKKNADKVKKEIKKLAPPQLAYAKALKKRDELLPEWILSLSKLERVAAAAWVDEPGTFETVFALPGRDESPVHHRAPSPPPPDEAPHPGEETGAAS